MAKEAQARIKINQMLERAGWRFFDTREINSFSLGRINDL